MTTRTDDTDRAEQAAWFENFNPRRDDDAEQAEFLRHWRVLHPAKPRRITVRALAWFIVYTAALLLATVPAVVYGETGSAIALLLAVGGVACLVLVGLAVKVRGR